MKAINDPRHQRRRTTVRQLFAVMFSEEQETTEQVQAVLENKDQIDELITANAPEWPLDKLNRIDLAILRLAIYELVIEKKEPIKVIIDEAVELAKEMGSENSPSFINGVLGSIVKDDERLKENKEDKELNELNELNEEIEESEEQEESQTK